MTAQTVDRTPSTQVKALAPIAWKFPIVYTILALVSLIFFGLIGRDGDTTFRVATGGDFFAIPDFAVSSTAAGLTLGILLVIMAAMSIYVAIKHGLRGAFVGLIRRGKRRIRHWRGQTSTSLILRVQHIVHIHAGAEFKSISDRVVMQPSDMPLF